MSITIRIQVSNSTLASLYEHLHRAYVKGRLRLVRRIHVLLSIIEGKSVAEIATMFKLSLQTIYNYVKAFILNELKSLVYRQSTGRPAKLNAEQREELGKIIDVGPEAVGYD